MVGASACHEVLKTLLGIVTVAVLQDAYVNMNLVLGGLDMDGIWNWVPAGMSYGICLPASNRCKSLYPYLEHSTLHFYDFLCSLHLTTRLGVEFLWNVEKGTSLLQTAFLCIYHMSHLSQKGLGPKNENNIAVSKRACSEPKIISCSSYLLRISPCPSVSLLFAWSLLFLTLSPVQAGFCCDSLPSETISGPLAHSVSSQIVSTMD